MDTKETPEAVKDDTSSEDPSCENRDPPDAAAATLSAPEKPAEEKSVDEETSNGESQQHPSTPPSPKVDTNDPRRSSGPSRPMSASASSPVATRNPISVSSKANAVSEWSHQQLAPTLEPEVVHEDKEEWQEMPSYAPYDIYDDDNKLIAKENEDFERVHGTASPGYLEFGGAAKGYTRVQVDEDAQSATSMDDNTAYLFKEPGTNVNEDEDARDALAQMQATKNLLTPNQRIAYVGLVRLATSVMSDELADIERTRASKKLLSLAAESLKLWAQKIMVRLYGHMELDAAEQIMIEQLTEHGLQASDLTPALRETSTVKNPVLKSTSSEHLASNGTPSTEQPEDFEKNISETKDKQPGSPDHEVAEQQLPSYQEATEDQSSVPQDVQLPSQLPNTENIDIDLRWTVLCDLFLILISDSTYDARSRVLLEKVGSFLDVPTLDICRFEKRVTEALEMEEDAQNGDFNEADHIEERRKRARKRRLMMMGLATVGGGLVIGLSAGLLAPVIGAGLAAGFTTIGVTGTSGFLAGAGGAAVIGSGAALTGGTIGVRAAGRRTGAVKTFEYRPLHNNKRVNLIVTIAGWMNGKVDDVRLPFSTVDPIMGDLYSLHWEPEMLRSMGDTINILATEALTQGLQQLLGSTILISLMAALQLPVVLSKLSYLIDNPWSNSLARADAAGLILADSLIDRNLGVRPITLVGFSVGSRMIYNCLKELARKGAVGIIQNVYLFGSPVVIRKDEYLRARTVVSGRFVNGYAKNDWILAYLFRATSGGIGRVAGLAEVDIPGIENIDVTENVPGHMAYRQSMPKLLRQVGWVVTSDEFTEIEDPDPDNHDRRQRELINEIEEARKELEEQPEKRSRFSIFKRPKKSIEKKSWETYDERLKGGVDDPPKANGEAGSEEGALFDVDAIRKEVVELAAEGIEIKELKSTMPPMKINLEAQGSKLPMRETQSYEGLPVPTEDHGAASPSSWSLDARQNDHDTDTNGKEGEIQMTFENSQDHHTSTPSSTQSGTSSPSPFNEPSRAPNGHDYAATNGGKISHLSRESPSAHPIESNEYWSHEVPEKNGYRESPGQDAANSWSKNSEPGPSTFNPDRNVWAEEEEGFGNEKEVKMTFE